MKSTIILGSHNDFHAQHMLKACRHAGLKTELLDTSMYPHNLAISWHPQHHEGCITSENFQLAFKHIHSVFWSSVDFQPASQAIQSQEDHIAISDSASMLRTFLQHDQIHWFNAWSDIQFHKVKPRQLSLAATIGIKIPDTYVGNDHKALAYFAEDNRTYIYKPVYGGALSAKLTPSLLQTAHLKRVLARSPVTIQEYIEGDNIRTFVIGDKVFSGMIESDQIDYRADSDVIISAISLPDTIEKQAIDITRQFGMRWTAIDWRRTKKGDYYFLEANPSPMFVHFENQTKHDITGCLVSLLKA